MPESFTVIVADEVSAPGLRPLTRDERFDTRLAFEWDPERLREEIGGAHGLIVRSKTRVTRELLNHAPRLRVIGRAGAGVDNIDLEAATEAGIPVLNAPAGNTVSVAELTLALILSLIRGIPAADRSVRAGEWLRSRFAGSELRGKVLGLVGAGRVGCEVARRAHAFGMKTVAYDPYVSEGRAREIGLEMLSLEEVLSRGDVISLHVPLTSSTEGMIGADQLLRMKRTAFLVNAARGGVVHEGALVEALEGGEIAGAALDVFAKEPLGADSPLRSAPNLVLTPHLGASTAEAQELVASEIAQAVRGALLHGDLSRALNAPSIGGEEVGRLRPLLGLGEAIGRLGCVLSPGGIRGVETRYAGRAEEALKLLRASVLTGLLSGIVGAGRVNAVSALHIARGRGIRASASLLGRRSDYTEFLEVSVAAEGGSVSVAGALLGDRHPRIVRIDGYDVDILPEGSLLILRNRDVPGVIGRVGTLLGSHGLNIAGYHQARLSVGGEALAAVSVDGVVSPSLIEALRAIPEIADTRVAELS